MNYRCNTPVLLIFFNRPDTFKKVFEQVKKAKPKTVILAQDGPRDENDMEGIAKCRAIAENIDWDCEIIKEYSKTNLGCGVRPQSAISSALKRFESIIILEDDCVPSESFFRYCDELLEFYKDDDRVAYISGLNHFEKWNCGDHDYFFTRAGAIWGWATWARSWNKYYDYNVDGIQDPYIRKLYCQTVGDKNVCESRIMSLEKANQAQYNNEKLSYWDTQWGFAEYTQNMLAIVPRVNLIHNIGVGETSTHAKKLKVTKWEKYKNFVFIPTHELEFPLRKSNFCACDLEYHELVYKCSRGKLWKRIIRRILKIFHINK